MNLLFYSFGENIPCTHGTTPYGSFSVKPLVSTAAHTAAHTPKTNKTSKNFFILTSEHDFIGIELDLCFEISLESEAKPQSLLLLHVEREIE